MTVIISDEGFEAWRTAADTMPGMIFTARADGTVEFVNRRWLEFSGFAEDAVLDLAWRKIVHPDDLATTVAILKHALKTSTEMTLEARVRRPDGQYVWLHVSAAPMFDSDGEVVRWYGTAIDIDALKRADEALREREALLIDSERRFRVLAEAIPVICWTADSEGWIDWYNRRWYEYTGQTPDEASGWGWQAAHHPDDFLEVMRRWPHSIATGDSFEMEFRLRRNDGLFHWFLTRAEPLRDAIGTIVRWYGSNVDIDAQKKALERTKRIAETLQDVFLPKELPKPTGMRLDAVYLPAERDALVGGDWFDAFELPDSRICFSIGDVAGHGLSASVVVGRLRQAIFTLAQRMDDPAKILEETDRILRRQDPDTLVTALVGFVDQARTSMTYASAGHPPPMIAYDGNRPAMHLPTGELPLGIGDAIDVVNHVVPIKPDAVVALYTDGLVEFSHDVLGVEERLAEAVALVVGNTTISRPALAVKDLIFRGRPPLDDAALMLLQFSHIDHDAVSADASGLKRTWRFHSSDAFTAHASRHEIMAYLRRLAVDPEQVFTGELILGEILANTVEHAPGLVEVDVDWMGEKPIVTIRDTGPGMRPMPATLPEDLLSEGGRGIYLITELSEGATIRPTPGYGTEVRAVLPIARKL
ncbi:MAG TPA: PAS domain-containing protein [Candidatus Eremiobacteraceae bacterium]